MEHLNEYFSITEDKIRIIDIISWSYNDEIYTIVCKSYFDKNDVIQILNSDETIFNGKLIVTSVITKNKISTLNCKSYLSESKFDLTDKKLRYYSNCVTNNEKIHDTRQPLD